MTETPGKGKPRRSNAAASEEAVSDAAVPDAAVTEAPPTPHSEPAGTDRPGAETVSAQAPWSPSEPSATETPSVEPPLPPAARPWGWVAAAILVLLIVGAAASFPLWRDRVLPKDDSGAAQIAALQSANQAQAQRMAALEQQLARLAERSAQPGAAAAAPAPDLSPIEGRLRALEAQRDSGEAQRALQTAQQSAQQAQRLAQDLQQIAAELRTQSQAVQQLQGSSAQASTVLRLSERLDAAEGNLRQLMQRRGDAEALLLAVGQLREAINSERPFDLELRAVRTLAGRSPEMLKATDSLTSFATAGVPGRAELVDRFERLAPLIVRASAGPEGEGWWPETVQRLSALISIRRIDGDAAGDSAPAMVTRAEAAVKAGRFDRALGELKALQGRALETARPWLDAAQARIAADKAVADLSAQALANLAGPRPAAGAN